LGRRLLLPPLLLPPLLLLLLLLLRLRLWLPLLRLLFGGDGR
jgi:hypothetical protein